MKRILLSVSALMVTFSTVNAQEYLDDIMFQSFGWDEYQQNRIATEGSFYEYYNSRVGNLKANGFDMVWLPPPSVSTGGVGYFPTELFNFSQTAWGSEAQLTKMLFNMNQKGIYPIADVVANHRSGTNGWMDFVNPTWGCDAIVINDEATAAYDEGKEGVSCRPSGAMDTGEGFEGSRDIDHTNATVRNDYKEYLRKLKNLGFKGWRWDVAKGFSAQYFGEYIADSKPYFSVGEYWDGNANNLKNWIDGTINAGANVSSTFDFASYYTLSSIIQENAHHNYYNLRGGSNNSMAGLSGMYGYAGKSVTFVDNHDTFVHNSAFQGGNIMKAYAYILTHPGIPSVFAPHYYGGIYSKDGKTRDYGSGYAEAINKLTAIRKTAGINAYSHITIDRAEHGLYATYIKKDFSDAEPVVAMKLGWHSWSPQGEGWVLATSGNDYAVWTKTEVNTPPTIDISGPATNQIFITGTTQNITLSATDPEGAATVIRYTLDGTEPTMSSPIYTNTLTINSTTTVKAVSFDDKGVSSGTMEKTYTFSTPKDIVIRFKPEGLDWDPVYLHYWNVTPSIGNADWNSPVAMTADSENVGWYTYTFPASTSASFLFRNAAGNQQTTDISNVTESTCYVWDTVSSSVKNTDCHTLRAQEMVTDKMNFYVVNPITNGELKVKYSNAKDGNLKLYDLTGKLLKTYKLSGSGAEVFSISGVPVGVYILQLNSDSHIVTEKVIIK